MIRLIEVAIQRQPAPALPNLIVGILVVVVGILIVKRREKIYRGTVGFEKRAFGKGLGDLLERLQSPFWVGAVGVVGVLMGLVMIGYAVWRFFT